MKTNYNVFLESDSQIKKEIVQEILLDLPEWFGMPEATAEYVENCQKYLLWVIKEESETVGFISLKETSSYVAEIYCMGVKKVYHQQGCGQTLFNEFREYCSTRYQFIQVKTVAEGYYETYDKTIEFYKAMGFVELEILPTLWDEWNPCLVLIQSL